MNGNVIHWSLHFWLEYCCFRALEQSLGSGVSDPFACLEIWLAYIDYLRRKMTDKDDDKEKHEKGPIINDAISIQGQLDRRRFYTASSFDFQIVMNFAQCLIELSATWPKLVEIRIVFWQDTWPHWKQTDFTTWKKRAIFGKVCFKQQAIEPNFGWNTFRYISTNKILDSENIDRISFV